MSWTGRPDLTDCSQVVSLQTRTKLKYRELGRGREASQLAEHTGEPVNLCRLSDLRPFWRVPNNCKLFVSKGSMYALSICASCVKGRNQPKKKKNSVICS